jgi:predicted RND superfamily exporter protein
MAMVTAGLGVFAARVEIEQNNESMNSLSPAEMRVHDAMRETFGEDEDLVVAVGLPTLASEASLRELAGLTAGIESIPGVRRVYSLTNAIELVPGRDGAVEQPLLPAFACNRPRARHIAQLLHLKI